MILDTTKKKSIHLMLTEAKISFLKALAKHENTRLSSLLWNNITENYPALWDEFMEKYKEKSKKKGK